MAKEFPDLVAEELTRSRNGHKPLNSAHEAFAVILEEVDEFWAEVRLKPLDPGNTLRELVQIAAMVQRAAEDLGLVEDQS